MNRRNLPKIKREFGYRGASWLRGSDKYGSLLRVSCTRPELTAVSLSEGHEKDKEIGECILKCCQEKKSKIQLKKMLLHMK